MLHIFIICLNSSLCFYNFALFSYNFMNSTKEVSMYRVNEDGNNNNKFKKRLERKGSRAPESVCKLNPPVISDIGEYFDVHVTLVAHPGHFIVQPLNNANELKVCKN